MRATAERVSQLIACSPLFAV